MEKFSPNPEIPLDKPITASEQSYNALKSKKDQEILETFTAEQQSEIVRRQGQLAYLAHSVSKDFDIPVYLNEPGGGWHWDFENNVIRIDPKDLLEKDMDYLRFVISHEGGHRRISRTDFIPLEIWRQPGFAFLMNAIEDPRMNTFVAEKYQKFREQMERAYKNDLDFETKAKEKADQKLGYQPRYMQAGFEYIKQWFKWYLWTEENKENINKDYDYSERLGDLPKEVKDVVEQTIKNAEDSWREYPSHAMADGVERDHDGLTGEDSIKAHAQSSYEINYDKIWPEFKKLVEADMEDQKTQEFLKDMQKSQEKKEGESDERDQNGLPQDIKDKLTPEEQTELEEAINEAVADSEGETGRENMTDDKAGEVEDKKGTLKPVDLDSLSDNLKQKIKDYISALPDDQQEEIAKKAHATFKEFEDVLNEELQGKMSQTPEKKKQITPQVPESDTEPEKEAKSWQEQEQETIDEQRKTRERMEAPFEKGDKHPYEKELIEVSDSIDILTADLRDVFVKRKKEKHETGYRSGRRWNVRQRIREMVAGIPLFQTEAREQKENESEEMDYAITILVDLSGSMKRNRKIEETFKSVVVLTETLNNLDIKFEIVGFQDILLEFKSFEDHLDDQMRDKLNQLILEVSDDNNPGGHNNSGDNDDGACLLEASKHLASQPAKNKFLIVVSDGEPAMDSGKKGQAQLKCELKEAIAEITGSTNQKLIAIGLMSKAVTNYYENSIADVTTDEMVEIMGTLLRDVIERY